MSVYFVESGPYMKIGFSKDPFSRTASVTRNGTRPDDLPFHHDAELIGWIPGDRKVERRMHDRFASLRVAGEWFWSERGKVEALIWDDPRGVDIHRMSAVAVFAMRQNPGMTRDEIANGGISILAVPLEDALHSIFGPAS